MGRLGVSSLHHGDHGVSLCSSATHQVFPVSAMVIMVSQKVLQSHISVFSVSKRGFSNS